MATVNFYFKKQKKADKQATLWEYFVTKRLHETLLKLLQLGKMQKKYIGSFVNIKHFTIYNDGCFSLMNYYKNGSLLVSIIGFFDRQ